MSEVSKKASISGSTSLNKKREDSMSSTKSGNGPQLPWWVELLFVQIGLPDQWLPNLLQAKREVKQCILNNKKTLYYSSLILVSLIYIQPIIKDSKEKNFCRTNYKNATKDIISSNQLSKLEQRIIANNYCNGGSLN